MKRALIIGRAFSPRTDLGAFSWGGAPRLPPSLPPSLRYGATGDGGGPLAPGKDRANQGKSNQTPVQN